MEKKEQKEGRRQLAYPTGEVVMDKKESERLRRKLRELTEEDREILRKLEEHRV